MPLMSNLVIQLQAQQGSGTIVEREYSQADASLNELMNTLDDIQVDALSTKAISLWGVTTGRFFFLQTSVPLDVQMTTPLGVANVPTITTLRVNDIIMFTSSVTTLSLTNTNNIPAIVKITILGV